MARPRKKSVTKRSLRNKQNKIHIEVGGIVGKFLEGQQSFKTTPENNMWKLILFENPDFQNRMHSERNRAFADRAGRCEWFLLACT